MIDKSYIDMMNKEIDGVTTGAEREKLSTYLHTNSEAKKLYNELCQTSALLSKVTRLQPSPKRWDACRHWREVKRWKTWDNSNDHKRWSDCRPWKDRRH